MEVDSIHALDELRTRRIPFAGTFEPVQHRCRAPRPDGQLCERQDRLKVRPRLPPAASSHWAWTWGLRLLTTGLCLDLRPGPQRWAPWLTLHLSRSVACPHLLWGAWGKRVEASAPRSQAADAPPSGA